MKNGKSDWDNSFNIGLRILRCSPWCITTKIFKTSKLDFTTRYGQIEWSCEVTIAPENARNFFVLLIIYNFTV